MQMLDRDLDAIVKAPASAGVVQLLPLFDPYLLGHVNRDHLYEAIHRSRVSRTAGWISAVVLVDGRVAGTWTHGVAKQVLRVAIEPFLPLKAKTLLAVRQRAESLAQTLGLPKAEVGVAEGR
jgi:hypothetical protein